MMAVFRRISGTLISFVLLVSIAWAWLVVESRILKDIRTRTYVASVEISTTARDSVNSKPGIVVIGRTHLGQRKGTVNSAETNHVRLTHENGDWYIANVAEKRRVWLSYEKFGELYLKRWEIKAGDTLTINGMEIEIVKANSETLQLETDDQRKFTYTLAQGGEVVSVMQKTERWLENCEERPIQEVARNWLQDKLPFFPPPPATEVVTIGGSVDCPSRIGMAVFGEKLNLARIIWDRGVLFLAPGRDPLARVRMRRQGTMENLGFSAIKRPLFGTNRETVGGRELGVVKKLILGRTHYKVKLDEGGKLVLESDENIHLYFAPPPRGEVKRLDLRPDNLKDEILTTSTQTDKIGVLSNRGKLDGLAPSEEPGYKFVFDQIPLFLCQIRFPKHENRASMKLPWTDIECADTNEEGYWGFLNPLTIMILALLATLRIVLSAEKRRQTSGTKSFRVAFQGRWWRLLLWLPVLTVLVYLAGLLSPGVTTTEIPRDNLTWLVIAGWGVATLSIVLSGENRLATVFFWIAMSVLIIVGSLNLELFGQASADTRWFSFDIKHARSIMIVFSCVVFIQMFSNAEWSRFFIFVIHSREIGARLILSIPVVVLVSMFLLWLVVGSEEGLGNIQPMEAGKFFAVFSVSILVVRYIQNEHFASFRSRRISYLIYLIVFLLFSDLMFLVIPAAKRDYSPILILTSVEILFFFGIAIVWFLHILPTLRFFPPEFQFKPPPGQPSMISRSVFLGEVKRVWRCRVIPFAKALRQGLRWTFLVFGILLGVGLAYAYFGLLGAAEREIRSDDKKMGRLLRLPPEEFFNGLRVPKERIIVWMEPYKHPEIGFQLQKSRQHLMATPCYELDRQVFKAMTEAIPFRIEVAVPESCSTSSVDGSGGSKVDDRKAPRISEYFGATPLGLMALPAVQDDFILTFFINRFGWSGALLLLVAQFAVFSFSVIAPLQKYSFRGGNYADDTIRQTLCFTSFGGGLLLLTHWTLSWGNAFGFLPVMGQPMTWLSSANSHILFMALPILVSTLLLLRLPDPQRSAKKIDYERPPRPNMGEWHNAT